MVGGRRPDGERVARPSAARSPTAASAFCRPPPSSDHRVGGDLLDKTSLAHTGSAL
jgi:hypothetical protein